MNSQIPEIIRYATLAGQLRSRRFTWEQFARSVVPELQKRGLFRTEYTGTTLREHMGLPRPENKFFTRNQAAE